MARGNEYGAVERQSQVKLLFWFLALLVSVNLSVVSYLLIGLRSLELRVTTIEANRWTSRDGAQVFEGMARIHEKLAALPSEYPPTWVREYIAENRQEINKLKDAKEAKK